MYPLIYFDNPTSFIKKAFNDPIIHDGTGHLLMFGNDTICYYYSYYPEKINFTFMQVRSWQFPTENSTLLTKEQREYTLAQRVVSIFSIYFYNRNDNSIFFVTCINL